MELIKIINKKSIAAILSIIAVLTFSTNSFAIKIYTSKLSEGDQLKFTGTAWKVFKTKKIAKSVANGEKPKAKRTLKNGEKLKILDIDGNVLKIAKNEYIYYGSTASKYFKTISKAETSGSKEEEGNFPIPDVKVKVESVKLNVYDVTLKVGDEKKLTAAVKPTNAEDKTIKWTSSNSKVATVNSRKVTAIKEGTAKITATAQDGSGTHATAIIHVVAKATSKEKCNHPTDKLVKVNPKNPHGSTEHEVDILCKKCNKIIKTGTDSHHLGSWIIKKEATCTQDGEKRRVCECGYYESQKINKKGHNNKYCKKYEMIQNDEYNDKELTLCYDCKAVLSEKEHKHTYQLTKAEENIYNDVYIGQYKCFFCGARKIVTRNSKKILKIEFVWNTEKPRVIHTY